MKKKLWGKVFFRVASIFLDPEENKNAWTQEELTRLFSSYKIYGTKWSVMVQLFPGRTENDIKNKFYTTLKRVATRAQLEDPEKYSPSFIKCKSNLVQFVDAAMLYGSLLPSKRGRKRNTDRLEAEQNCMIVQKPQTTSQNIDLQPPAPPASTAPQVLTTEIQGSGSPLPVNAYMEPVMPQFTIPANPFQPFVNSTCWPWRNYPFPPMPMQISPGVNMMPYQMMYPNNLTFGFR